MTEATHTAARHAKPLRVWEKVELQIGDEPDAGHYLARVQDFINGGIVITDPEFLYGATLLRENVAVLVMVRRDDAMYQFASTIKKNLGKGGRQFILSPPRHYERVQRRMFVRVNLSKKISYAQIVPLGEWQSYEDRLSWCQSQTIDLSASGSQIKVVDELSVGELILVRMEYLRELRLPDTIVAQVRRCFRLGGEWRCGAHFVLADQLSSHLEPREISALPGAVTRFNRHAQNSLSSAVFGLQVELRKKGLL